MRVSRVLAYALVILAVAGPVANSNPKSDPNEEKVYVVDDSLKLSGWLMRDTMVTNEPLIVLLHMMGMTHESYQPFVDALE